MMKRATIKDLYREPGKAEIVNGEIVRFPLAGQLSGNAAGAIFVSLRLYARKTGQGRAVGANAGYHVDLPNREAFCPDASFYLGRPMGMKFFEGAPIFAVEVRNEEDYGETIERSKAAQRQDYFAAGTLVVWDVDLLGDNVIAKYTAAAPDHPQFFRWGEIADAESAVPEWTMPVDELFE